MTNQDFDCFIIGSHHRKSMTPDFFKGSIQFEQIMTPDVNLKNGWKPDASCAHYVRPDMELWNRVFRCSTGHRMALQQSKSQHVLIVQDDCKPNRNDWFKILIQSRKYLNEFQIVSLHSRKPNLNDFKQSQFDTKFPQLILNRSKNQKFKHRYALGSLIYWIKRDSIQKHIDLINNFKGMPRDIQIASMGSFAFVSQSPFDHIEHNKSLIDIK